MTDVVKSDWFADQVERVVREEFQKPEYAWFRFIKHIQGKLMKADPALDGKRAFEIARNVYNTHLRDEKIEFGDPRFGWTAADAHELAQAYEIDHWEPR